MLYVYFSLVFNSLPLFRISKVSPLLNLLTRAKEKLKEKKLINNTNSPTQSSKLSAKSSNKPKLPHKSQLTANGDNDYADQEVSLEAQLEAEYAALKQKMYVQSLVIQENDDGDEENESADISRDVDNDEDDDAENTDDDDVEKNKVLQALDEECERLQLALMKKIGN